jgi:acyl carrier protein
MNNDQIIKEINRIFIDVLENDNLLLTRETTAMDVDDWDSLNHIQLVVAIEKHFKLRFTTGEINRWKNIGEMSDTIAEKLAK